MYKSDEHIEKPLFHHRLVVRSIGQFSPNHVFGSTSSSKPFHMIWPADVLDKILPMLEFRAVRRVRTGSLRNYFVFQATQEKYWNIGNLWQGLLARPYLGAQSCNIFCRWENTASRQPIENFFFL